MDGRGPEHKNADNLPPETIPLVPQLTLHITPVLLFFASFPASFVEGGLATPQADIRDMYDMLCKQSRIGPGKTKSDQSRQVQFHPSSESISRHRIARLVTSIDFQTLLVPVSLMLPCHYQNIHQ